MGNRILTLNIGAGSLALAEFAVKPGKAPELLGYGFTSCGEDAEGQTPDYGALAAALLKEKGLHRAPLLVALSGQTVFARYVKLPAVDADKMKQMLRYEVEQNVPFPLEEVVWCSQLLGDASTGEQAAAVVAVKLETVREIVNSLAAAGFDVALVDTAPTSLYNCLRFNRQDLDGCSVLLDIGARSSNLVFAEGERLYSRCIPVAGNAITSELSRTFGITAEEAEKLKCSRGFVSLGGVYQAEDETDEKISKVVRNVITRLHAEISRSVNFYRSQQDGAAPGRMIVTGGSSAIPNLDVFFREKMGVAVEVLNPFANVSVAAGLDTEALSVDAFRLASCVGLALRRSAGCPVEVNLLPPEAVAQKELMRKVPFLGLAALGILACLGVWTYSEGKLAEGYEASQEELSAKFDQVNAKVKALQAAERARDAIKAKADVAIALVNSRGDWLRCLKAVETSVSQFPGMWVTSLAPLEGEGGAVVGVRLDLRVWNDRFEEGAGDRKGTVDEQLIGQLRAQSVFGKGAKDIVTQGLRDVDGYVTEFKVDARFASASLDEQKDGEE